MKGLALLLTMKISAMSALAQGSTCATAIPLNLNGTPASYATSASTGGNMVCASAGQAPVTWFSFTTNTDASCPLLNITASDGQPCEIAMYTGCNGGQALQTASSMCFDDGTGLWAPAETYAVSPNQTYYLRIRTATACTLNIAGQHYMPPNNDCNGATSITEAAQTDQNACHTGGPGVFPDQLCAFTLENTAFYKFIVASYGSSIINISDIACDNGAGNNMSGFQIGFFTGECGSLTPLNCTSGTGSFVQATTPQLAAGTKVYVAIDGMAGSNCRYSISGINVYGVLDEAEFRYFSGWKQGGSNLLKWTAGAQGVRFYQAESSRDGAAFTPAGKAYPPSGKSSHTFTIEDNKPFIRTYYRIKQVRQDGGISYSHTIMITRTGDGVLRATRLQADPNRLDFQVETGFSGRLEYAITGMGGEMLMRGSLQCNTGTNRLSRNISMLPSGKYLIIFYNRETRHTESFLKL